MPKELYKGDAALVVTPGISAFFLSVPRMVFEQIPARGHKRHIELCAVHPGRIALEGGLSADVDAGLELLEHSPIIIVPFWPDPLERPDDALLSELVRAYERGAFIIGLCRGGFVLGYAGLLDGREAATHWADADAFKKCFPRARLNTKALYVDDGRIATSAGIVAGIDCCLHVLRRLEGAAVANETARLMVAPPFREGGQAQFIDYAVPSSTKDDRINRAVERLSTELSAPPAISALAAESSMSERTFFRAFERSTGMTPYQWLTAARLKRAQELLEKTTLSIEAVAGRCGFDSPVTFRQRFKAQFGVSPAAWRRVFH